MLSSKRAWIHCILTSKRGAYIRKLSHIVLWRSSLFWYARPRLIHAWGKTDVWRHDLPMWIYHTCCQARRFGWNLSMRAVTLQRLMEPSEKNVLHDKVSTAYLTFSWQRNTAPANILVFFTYGWIMLRGVGCTFQSHERLTVDVHPMVLFRSSRCFLRCYDDESNALLSTGL